MTNKIQTAIKQMGTPKSVNVKSFDELLQDNIELAKEVLGKDWYPLESDPYMKKIRVMTLRQLHNQADKNHTILSFLPTTATYSDLDNIGIDRTVVRDIGEYPYAQFTFFLTAQSDGTFIIPKGTRVTAIQNNQYWAETVYDVTVPKGQSSVTIPGQFSVMSESNDIVLDTLMTDLSYVHSIKQITNFANGKDIEKDERYRLRIILSRSQYNTTGTDDAYAYFAFTADSRVDDVVIHSPQALEIDIYIASFDGVDEVMKQRVYSLVTERLKRSLNDVIRVIEAPKKEINAVATIEIFDLSDKERIEATIRANFQDNFFIGEHFTRSDFIRKCHIDGVFRVLSSFEDVIVSDIEIIELKSLTLLFEKANA